jgi:hypothetical protein
MRWRLSKMAEGTHAATLVVKRLAGVREKMPCEWMNQSMVTRQTWCRQTRKAGVSRCSIDSCSCDIHISKHPSWLKCATRNTRRMLQVKRRLV